MDKMRRTDAMDISKKKKVEGCAKNLFINAERLMCYNRLTLDFLGIFQYGYINLIQEQIFLHAKCDF